MTGEAGSGPLTVLVVGATGSVGRHAVDAALERGDRVLALSRSASAARVRADAEVVDGDIANPSTLQLPDVDAVVFTHGSHGGVSDAERIDYGAVKNVLQALGDRPARVALMTAIGVTGDHYAPARVEAARGTTRPRLGPPVHDRAARLVRLQPTR